MTNKNWTLSHGLQTEEYNRPQWSLVFFCLMVAATLAASTLTLAFNGAVLLWPVGAVALAGLWLLGWRWGVAAVVTGAAVGGLLVPLGHSLLLTQIITALVTGCVGSLLMHRLQVGSELSNPRDMLLFLGCAVVLAPLLAHLISAAVPQAMGASYLGADRVWWHYAIAEITACLLILPLVFTADDADRVDRTSATPFVATIFLCSAIVYLDLLPTQWAAILPLVYIAFPLMLFAAFRLSQRAVAGLLLLNGLLALWGTAYGMGPFKLLDSSESLIALHGFLILLSASSLLFSVFLSEYRRTINSYKKSAEDHRQILENQAEVLVKTDARGQLLYSTQNSQQWVPEEAENHFLSWFSEHSDGGSYTRMRARLMSGERVTQNQTLDDSILRWTLSPVRDSNCALVSVIAVGHDVTVESLTEQRVHRRLKELSYLDRKSSMAQAASALISDLEQPLAEAIAFTQAAERLLPAGDSAEDSRKALVRAAHNTQCVADIARQTRRFKAPDNFVRQRYNLVSVARGTILLMEAGAYRSGIKLLLAPVSCVPWARVAAIQIQQILVNFIRDSIQRMAGQTTNKQITVHVDRDEQDAWLDVRDTGSSLSVAVFQRAFEPFSSKQGVGADVSLRTCHSIAQSYGGSISLVPTKNGTCIRLKLPLEIQDGDTDDEGMAELMATII